MIKLKEKINVKENQKKLNQKINKFEIMKKY